MECQICVKKYAILSSELTHYIKNNFPIQPHGETFVDADDIVGRFGVGSSIHEEIRQLRQNYGQQLFFVVVKDANS